MLTYKYNWGVEPLTGAKRGLQRLHKIGKCNNVWCQRVMYKLSSKNYCIGVLVKFHASCLCDAKKPNTQVHEKAYCILPLSHPILYIFYFGVSQFFTFLKFPKEKCFKKLKKPIGPTTSLHLSNFITLLFDKYWLVLVPPFYTFFSFFLTSVPNLNVKNWVK